MCCHLAERSEEKTGFHHFTTLQTCLLSIILSKSPYHIIADRHDLSLYPFTCAWYKTCSLEFGQHNTLPKLFNIHIEHQDLQHSVFIILIDNEERVWYTLLTWWYIIILVSHWSDPQFKSSSYTIAHPIYSSCTLHTCSGEIFQGLKNSQPSYSMNHKFGFW